MLNSRRFPPGLLAICVALSAALPTSAATPRTYMLTRENSGETVVVNVGDRVIVSLPRRAGAHGAWRIEHPEGGDAKLVSVHDARDGYRADFHATRAGLVTVTLNALTYTFDVERGQLAKTSFDAAPARPHVLSAPRAPVALIAAPIPVTNTNTVALRGAGSTVLPSGTEKYSDGSTYVGGLKNGLRNGDGTLTFASNGGNVKTETGDWTADVLTNGTVVLTDGTTYFGGLDAQGRLQGPGRFTNVDGSVLQSTFVDGLYSGQTVLLEAPDKANPGLPRGSVVVDVAPPSSLPSGAAKETFDDGSTIVGTLNNGVFSGPAAYVLQEDDSTFHGTFKDGVLQGPFTETDDRGVTIAGNVTGGTTEGPATLTERNGVKCIGGIGDTGEFTGFSGVLDRQARPDGFGTKGCRGEEQITGQFFHGKVVGKMIDHIPSGIVYVIDVGPYPQDDLVGRAFVRLPNDDRAIGYMAKDGLLTRRGSYLTASTNYLIRGTWRNGTIKGYSYSHGYFVLNGAGTRN